MASRGAPPSGKGMNPLVAGIIIGLLLGIFLALGVAMWLNRNATPFVEKQKPVEAVAPLPSTTPAKGATPPSTPAKSDPDKPRFEFYQILPGETKDGGKKSADTQKDPIREFAKEGKDAPKPAREAAKEPVTTPVKSLNETLYLQAGAFQSETEAQNLKAKIAFAGFEATVKPVNVEGKGTLYRVRLGPYKSQDEVNRIKGVLSQNGIGASVVKPE